MRGPEATADWSREPSIASLPTTSRTDTTGDLHIRAIHAPRAPPSAIKAADLPTPRASLLAASRSPADRWPRSTGMQAQRGKQPGRLGRQCRRSAADRSWCKTPIWGPRSVEAATSRSWLVQRRAVRCDLASSNRVSAVTAGPPTFALPADEIRRPGLPTDPAPRLPAPPLHGIRVPDLKRAAAAATAGFCSLQGTRDRRSYVHVGGAPGFGGLHGGLGGFGGAVGALG